MTPYQQEIIRRAFSPASMEWLGIQPGGQMNADPNDPNAQPDPNADPNAQQPNAGQQNADPPPDPHTALQEARVEYDAAYNGISGSQHAIDTATTAVTEAEANLASKQAAHAEAHEDSLSYRTRLHAACDSGITAYTRVKEAFPLGG